MGLAHRGAPPGERNYTRHFVIANTVISRLRELCPDAGHLPAWDIGNRLDASVSHAFAEGEVEQLWEFHRNEWSAFELVHLTEHLPFNIELAFDYYGMVVDADQPGDLHRALVRLVTPEEREDALQRDQWRQEEPTGDGSTHKPFADASWVGVTVIDEDGEATHHEAPQELNLPLIKRPRLQEHPGPAGSTVPIAKAETAPEPAREESSPPEKPEIKMVHPNGPEIVLVYTTTDDPETPRYRRVREGDLLTTTIELIREGADLENVEVFDGPPRKLKLDIGVV
jgi:hypothetical protein